MRYAAFISYSHKDRSWASWLHRQLESYRIPKALRGRDAIVGTLGPRLPPVFQDREELASSADLAASVKAALEEAATLIVICSPAAAASRWVNQEIETFIALGRADRIQCLIVDGEPEASRRAGLDPATECFPPALLAGGREPLAGDLRPSGDGKTNAKLKLIAGMIGVPYDALRQREARRRQRRLLIVAVASAIGLVITSGLAIFALLSRNEAITQRDIARRKTLTAERTVSFVKSMFEISDPSEAKGETMTAREILDRGRKQIELGLTNEPAVKADLGTTLGEVYLGLGLFKQGTALIRQSIAIPGRGSEGSARQYAALGDAYTRNGDYPAAIKAYDAALAAARAGGPAQADLMPRILNGLGEAQSSNGDYAAADRSAAQAYRIDAATLGNAHPDVARDLETLGLNAFFDNRLDQAKPLLARALAIRTKAQGEQHPKVSEDLNLLGSIAYLQRDSRSAESYYRRVIAVYERVLGPNHPDFATALNNLARVLLERRDYAEAKALLARSLAITLAQRGETFDDLAFTFANLALASRGMGDDAAAGPLFGKALRVAQIHKHRNLAPIMTDLADLQCARGDTPGGLGLLTDARPIMAKTYPDDPWRVAWVDNVRAGCLASAGRRAEAEPLLRTSTPVLTARWSADTLYGRAVAERAARFRRLGRRT